MLVKLNTMNAADTQQAAHLLSVAGLVRATGEDYRRVMQVLTSEHVQPELVIDDRPYYGRDALDAIRRHMNGGKP